MTSEEREKIIRGMTDFLPAETLYRALYFGCREAFCTPISDWDEFACRLRAAGYAGVIPKEAPSPIMPWLSESDFFPESGLDVAIVRNDRYCPPFMHKLEFIKLVYVAVGSAEIFMGGNKTKLDSGELCIVPPNVENAAFSCGDGDIVINVIVRRSTFERSFASLLLEKSLLSDYFWRALYADDGGGVLFFKKKGGGDLTELVMELYRELRLEAEPSNIMLKSYLMLFFGNMLRHYRIKSASGGASVSDPRVTEIIRYMEENRQTVTLPELSARFHLSDGYMSRLIRKETGESFKKLLQRLRLGNAAALLRNTSLPIEDVCASAGYTDISRFYRNFRERFGMTPAQFRSDKTR